MSAAHLRRVAELVLDEVLGQLGLLLDRLVRLANLLELGVELLDDLLGKPGVSTSRSKWSQRI